MLDPPIGAAHGTLIVDIICRQIDEREALVGGNFGLTPISRKVAAEEAIRATRECSPLPLPPDNYEQWKSFVFVFDPRFLSR